MVSIGKDKLTTSDVLPRHQLGLSRLEETHSDVLAKSIPADHGTTAQV